MRTIYRAGGTGAQELGAAPICSGAADRVLSLSRGHTAAREISLPGYSRWDPRKIEGADRPVNFAFPYC
jgi:hypothetical protein